MVCFIGCNSLINAPNIYFPNVVTFSNMFSNCVRLRNVPEYNASKVYNMGMMFRYCNNLSNTSIQDIINMCLNSDIPASNKNLSTSNYSSPFYDTKFYNVYYSNRLAELNAAGWKY